MTIQSVRISAPSPVSATCLLAELAPAGHAEIVENGSGASELVLEQVSEEELEPLIGKVSEWLRTCNLDSTEVEAAGARFTVTPN